MSAGRVGDLAVDEDLEFNRREWTVQRIGWGVMALVTVAALLGVTGGGGLGAASAGAGQRLQIEYSRFERVQAPATIDLRIDPAAATDGQIVLWVDSAYLDGVQIKRVMPEPVEVRDGPDRLAYIFAVAEPDQPLAVGFDLRHTTFGVKSAHIGLPDGSAVAFRQIVYP